MKTAPVGLAVILLCLAAAPSRAVVGYVNVSIYAGDNLIADQLLNSPNNTLDSTLVSTRSPVADGSTFTLWDPAAQHFLPVSTYSAFSDSWSINYNLTLGQGGLLHSPSAWIATFTGTVPNYAPLTSTLWQPNYPNGYYLLASAMPLGGNMDFMFTNVVGRAPVNGEWVKILDPATQVYTTTTFNAGTMTWDNGAPGLTAGESAWFDLGPVAVPEPSALALVGLGALALGQARRRVASGGRGSPTPLDSYGHPN